MSDDAYKKAKSEFDRTKTPYIDAVLSDGTRVATQKLKLSGGGGGGGSSGIINTEIKWNCGAPAVTKGGAMKIDDTEYFKLKAKYEKAVEFIQLIADHNVNYYGEVAADLLKELGETDE